MDTRPPWKKHPIAGVQLDSTPDGWVITYHRRKPDGSIELDRAVTAPNLDVAVDLIRIRVGVDGYITIPPSPPGRP